MSTNYFLCLDIILLVCYRIVGHLVDILPPNCQKVVLLSAKLKSTKLNQTDVSQLHSIKSHAKEITGKKYLHQTPDYLVYLTAC